MFSQNSNQSYMKLNFNSGYALDSNTKLVLSSRTTDAYPHTHSFFELMYINRGTIAHSINFSKPVVLKKKDFALIDKGSIHEYASIDKSGCEVINVAFSADFIDKRLTDKSKMLNIYRSSKLGLSGKYAIAPSDTILHDSNNDIINILDLISKELKNTDNLSPNILRHFLISLLISISRIANSENTNNLSDLATVLIDYIETNYKEQNLLSKAAKDLNYSSAYLSNKFHTEVGVSFNNYLQNYRIENAKHLINTTNMTIAEIASSVGYVDGKYFAGIFKRITGMMPSYYKKNVMKYIPDKTSHI